MGGVRKLARKKDAVIQIIHGERMRGGWDGVAACRDMIGVAGLTAVAGKEGKCTFVCGR